MRALSYLVYGRWIDMLSWLVLPGIHLHSLMVIYLNCLTVYEGQLRYYHSL